MKYKKESNFVNGLSALIVLLLAVGGIYLLLFSTNGFQNGVKDFYVTVGQETIFADRDNFKLELGKEYKFEVTNLRDVMTNGESTYSVKVLPNATEETNFAFTANGVSKNWENVPSLSNYFNITTSDTYFTLKASNIELQEMLQDVYKTSNIVGCPTAINSGLSYFKLVVACSNGETINIAFRLVE